MDTWRLELHFNNVSELNQEFNDNLKHGRAFIFDSEDVGIGSDCELVILHPLSGDELSLAARAVALVPFGSRMGLGLELLEWDDALAEALEIFVKETERVVVEEDPHEEPDTPFRPSQTSDLSSMPLPQQIKLARTANQEDRISLERRLGRAVWENLLHNPKITVPEVARIARKGTVPRPMLDIILDNATWMHSAPIRRALLANPRLSIEQVGKVLKSMPKSDLVQVSKNGAYPALVRDMAHKLSS